MHGYYDKSTGHVTIFTDEDEKRIAKYDRETYKRQMTVLAFIIGAVIGYFIAHNIVGAVIGAIVATTAKILITKFYENHPVLFKLIVAAIFVVWFVVAFILDYYGL